MKNQKKREPCKAREYLKKKWGIGDVKGMSQNMENCITKLLIELNNTWYKLEKEMVKSIL